MRLDGWQNENEPAKAGKSASGDAMVLPAIRPEPAALEPTSGEQSWIDESASYLKDLFLILLGARRTR